MSIYLDTAGYEQRILWIDAVKGACILLVLLAHTNLAAVDLNPYPNCILHHLHYGMACYMPVFFVLSGLTFKDSPNILLKRFKQLIIPYAIWGLVYYLYFLISSINRGEIYPLYWCKKLAGIFYSRCDLFADGAGFVIPLLPPGAGPLWFLTSLFTAYTLYLPLHRATKNRKPFLLSAYFITALVFNQCPILLPWSLDTAFTGAIFIYAGQCIKRFRILQARFKETIVTVAILLPLYMWSVNHNGGSGALYCRNMGHAGWYSPIIFIIMGTSGTILWCIFAQLLKKTHLVKVLAAIGRHTLILLCSHMLIFTIVRDYIVSYATNMKECCFFLPYAFVIQVSLALLFPWLLIISCKFIRKARTSAT